MILTQRHCSLPTGSMGGVWGRAWQPSQRDRDTAAQQSRTHRPPHTRLTNRRPLRTRQTDKDTAANPHTRCPLHKRTARLTTGQPAVAVSCTHERLQSTQAHEGVLDSERLQSTQAFEGALDSASKRPRPSAHAIRRLESPPQPTPQHTACLPHTACPPQAKAKARCRR